MPFFSTPLRSLTLPGTRTLLALLGFLIGSGMVTLTAQDARSLEFKDGDRISFLGNSITHSGTYHSLLRRFYTTRYPDSTISLINCGISGDVAERMLHRAKKDVLSHNPEYTFLMVGMNDVGRELYFSGEAAADTIALRQKALDHYRKKTDTLVRLLVGSGTVPILMTPSIYEQTALLDSDNRYGVNDALARCAEHIRQLSRTYALPLIDLHAKMDSINSKRQQRDSTFTLVGEDRVHPGTPGHVVMAYEILKALGEPEYVSKVAIHTADKKVLTAINASVENIATDPGQIRFDLREGALPFVMDPEERKALDLVPFMARFNRQQLFLTDVPSGSYQLKIDGVPVGIYTHVALQKGIDLAQNTHTPQYAQALKVAAICDTYHEKESALRTIPLIAYAHLSDYQGDGSLDSKEKHLAKKLEQFQGKPWYGYFEREFATYIKIKPLENELKRELETLQQQLYDINTPKTHRYVFTRE